MFKPFKPNERETRPQAAHEEPSKGADSTPSKESPSREEIERRAYEIYLERGGSHGQDLEDWLQAERDLGEKASKKAPAGMAKGA